MVQTRRTNEDLKRSLTKRQLRFLEEFPKDLNASQAARRAGYSARTAKAQGSRLLKQLHEHVSQYLHPETRELAPTAQTELQRYVQALERLSYEGSVAEITQEFRVKNGVHTLVGCSKKFRPSDKAAALALLGKVRGYYPDKNDRNPSPLESATTAFLLEMKAMLEKRQQELQGRLPAQNEVKRS